jgi:hypothetical protein
MASASYLAWSTATDPLATLRGARAAVSLAAESARGLPGEGYRQAREVGAELAGAGRSVAAGANRAAELAGDFWQRHGASFAAFDPSKHPHGEGGRWAPKVHVPDDPKYHGKKDHNINQPGGAPVRGTPIPHDHPSVPETLYHATSDLPAVLASGHLRASGEGGLGGDQRDRVVSLTTSRRVAEMIAREMKRTSSLARRVGPAPPFDTPERAAWGKEVAQTLEGWAAEDGIPWKPFDPQTHDFVYRQYGLGDWLTQYYTFREGRADYQSLKQGDEHAHLLDPQFWDAERVLPRIDPDKVGIVPVPRSSLDTGAMVTDFDLGNAYGLREVRHYGDVPLGPRRET